MEKLLASFAKTVPSNHTIRGIEVLNPDAETPGGTLDAAAWDKAKRQADPNYDWEGYKNSSIKIMFDHPTFAHRESTQALATQWNDILHELEKKPEAKEEIDE